MTKPVVILVHGFNVKNPLKTVGRLSTYLVSRGYDPVLLDYGHFTLLDVRYRNDDVAERLRETIQRARMSSSKVFCIGHSNGCAIIHLALSRFPHIKVDKAIYINPALKKDISIPSNVDSIDVYYSKSDMAVPLSKFLPSAKHRPWGTMGRDGYVGQDKRVESFDEEALLNKEIGHSDIFKCENLVLCGPRIAESLNG